MKNFFSNLGISGVALAIFLSIMVLLSLYFFVTLDNNQEALEKDGYRVLVKLGSNMKQKDTIYSRVVANLGPVIYCDTSPVLPHGFGNIAESLRHGKGNETDALYYPFVTAKDKKPDSAYVFLEKFITPLIRRDFFSDFIFIRDSLVSFSTFSGDVKLASVAPLPGKGNPSLAGSGLDIITGGQNANDAPSIIQAGSMYRVTIKGTNYLLFLIPLHFHHNPDCFLGGFIREKRFIQDKRSLPSDLIVLFIFILLLIVFSFPVLKVFIMGPREKLTRPGVTMIGISLITGTLLLAIMLSQQLIGYKMKSDQLAQLKTLNNSVKRSFVNEKDAILKQLLWYNRQKIDLSHRTKPSLSILDSVNSKNPLLKRPAYPFYKTVFWADSTGKQVAMLTPYLKGVPTWVNTREYFIHPDKYKFDSGWYNMEPIYSQTSGDWSVAFSMPSMQNHLKVVVMTSPVFSLKSPLLQQGFEYCLIDKTGKVWYHSNEILDLNDSLIKESHENKALISALSSNESDSMEVDVRNSKYLAYVSPVEHTDLFVVTFHNPARTKSIGSLTAMFVLCFFAVIYLILFLLYAAINLFRINKSKLAGKEYFFKWLLPGEQLNPRYWLLIRLNGLIFLLLIGMKISGSFGGLSLGGLMMSLIVLIIAHCILSYRVLSTAKGLRVGRLWKRMPVNFPWYTCYVVTWLLIIVVLPAILLTSALFSAETSNHLQRQQQFLAHAVNLRTESFHRFYKENLPSGSRDSLFRARNTKGLYFLCIDGEQILREPPHVLPGKAAVNPPALKLARSWFDRLMNETDPISTDPLIEGQYPGSSDGRNLLVFDRVDFNDNGEKIRDKSVISAQNPWAAIFDPFHAHRWQFPALLFWGLICVMLLFAGFLVDRLVKMLFFSCDPGCIQPPLLQELEEFADSRVSAIIVSYDQPDIPLLLQNRWNCIDMEQTGTPSSAPSSKGLVLINFETGIDNLDNFRTRVNLLDQLLNENLVMLWLDKTPEMLIAGYQAGWIQQNEKATLSSLISQFVKQVSAMPCIYPSMENPVGTEEGLCARLSSILNAERGFNPGIQKYNRMIKKEIRCNCEKPTSNAVGKQEMEMIICSGAEELVLKIQELSSSFYDYVWSSLSEDEQFLLLDLAQDTLVNMKNRKAISLLFKKGILHRNERIEIVSPSFKNYILTDIDKSSFEKIQKRIEAEGNWQKFKVPLILIATSLAVFLFITQQNFLSNLNTILVSAGALIGVYLKFSGLFTKTGGT